MSKDKFLRYWCYPLLFLSVIAMPVFVVYDHYYGFNAVLLASNVIFFLAAFVPWVIVDEFGLLEWE